MSTSSVSASTTASSAPESRNFRNVPDGVHTVPTATSAPGYCPPRRPGHGGTIRPGNGPWKPEVPHGRLAWSSAHAAVDGFKKIANELLQLVGDLISKIPQQQTQPPAPTTPAPSTPDPSTPAPTDPTPTTPPETPVPTSPAPTTPAPSTPGPSTPGPSTPAPCAPVPCAPVPSTPPIATEPPHPAIAGRSSQEFLWKPVSEKDGKLVVLLPAALNGKVDRVELIGPKGKALGTGRYVGIANGDRGHFRFTKVGKDYPDGSTVRVTLKDGAVKEYTIPETSKRVRS